MKGPKFFEPHFWTVVATTTVSTTTTPLWHYDIRKILHYGFKVEKTPVPKNCDAAYHVILISDLEDIENRKLYREFFENYEKSFAKGVRPFFISLSNAKGTWSESYKKK